MGLERHTFLGMPAVIASEQMARVIETARRVARASVAVLITGETGSGKEIVARAIHHYSLRCSKPWVDINCGALPETLMESELVGHEKGAFSGADSAKAGLFELAHTGTLFLDEIGELDPRMQVKMLRVLDGEPYYRLGSQKKTSVDVRVLAASAGVPGKKFAEDGVRRLQARPWPGNIRELRNAVERALILASGKVVTAADIDRLLPQSDGAAGAGGGALTFEGFKQEAEKGFLIQKLREHDWNVSETARALKMPRSNLYKKIERYGLNREQA